MNKADQNLASIFLAFSAVTTLVVLGLVAGPWWAEMRQVMRLVRGGEGRSAASRAA
jgi:hypothetical protein